MLILVILVLFIDIFWCKAELARREAIEAESQALSEEEMQRQYEEFLEMVEQSRRNREQEYDQRRLQEEQPWLPQQDLFATYEDLGELSDMDDALLPPAPEDADDALYPTDVYETETDVSEDESILSVIDFSEEIHFSDNDE